MSFLNLNFFLIQDQKSEDLAKRIFIAVAKYLMLAIFSYMSRKSTKKVIKEFESFNRYKIGRNYFQSHIISTGESTVRPNFF